MLGELLLAERKLPTVSRAPVNSANQIMPIGNNSKIKLLNQQREFISNMHSKLCEGKVQYETNKGVPEDKEERFSFKNPKEVSLGPHSPNKVYPNPLDELSSKDGGELDQLNKLLDFMILNPESKLLNTNAGNPEFRKSQEQLCELIVTLGERTPQIPAIDVDDSNEILIEVQHKAQKLIKRNLDKNLMANRRGVTNLSPKEQSRKNDLERLIFDNSQYSEVGKDSRDLEKLRSISSLIDSIDSPSDLKTIKAITKEDTGEYEFTGAFYVQIKNFLGNDKLASELTEKVSKDMRTTLRFADPKIYDDFEWTDKDQQKIRYEVLDIQRKIFKMTVSKEFDITDNPASTAGFDFQNVLTIDQILALPTPQNRESELKKLRLSLIKDILFPLGNTNGPNREPFEREIGDNHKVAVEKYLKHLDDYQKEVTKHIREKKKIKAVSDSVKDVIPALNEAIRRGEEYVNKEEKITIPLKYLVDASGSLNGNLTVNSINQIASVIGSVSTGNIITNPDDLESSITFCYEDLGNNATEIRDNLLKVKTKADTAYADIDTESEINQLMEEADRVNESLFNVSSDGLLANPEFAFRDMLVSSIDQYKFSYEENGIDLQDDIFLFAQIALEHLSEDNPIDSVSVQDKQDIYEMMRQVKLTEYRDNLFTAPVNNISTFTFLLAHMQSAIQTFTVTPLAAGVRHTGTTMETTKTELEEIGKEYERLVRFYTTTHNSTNWVALSLKQQRELLAEETKIFTEAFNFYGKVLEKFDIQSPAGARSIIPSYILACIDNERVCKHSNSSTTTNLSAQQSNLIKELEANHEKLENENIHKDGNMEDLKQFEADQEVEKTFKKIATDVAQYRMNPALNAKDHLRRKDKFQRFFEKLYADPAQHETMLENIKQYIKDALEVSAISLGLTTANPRRADLDYNFIVDPDKHNFHGVFKSALDEMRNLAQSG